MAIAAQPQLQLTRLRLEVSVALEDSPSFANGVVGYEPPGQLNQSLGR